jgi:hypothetical protein
MATNYRKEALLSLPSPAASTVADPSSSDPVEPRNSPELERITRKFIALFEIYKKQRTEIDALSSANLLLDREHKGMISKYQILLDQHRKRGLQVEKLQEENQAFKGRGEHTFTSRCV